MVTLARIAAALVPIPVAAVLAAVFGFRPGRWPDPAISPPVAAKEEIAQLLAPANTPAVEAQEEESRCITQILLIQAH